MDKPKELSARDDKNKKLQDLELEEEKFWSENEAYNEYLYPSLNDPLFSQKLAQKKEFADTRYDGTLYDIYEQAEKLCNAEFELSPHQQFVRNFLSFYTPYNSLLLYHGLGSGKTCSAIGVAEEMRDYIKQLGINQRIIVVASPNVQKNFELQLFDESKLELVDGLWNIKSCTGNKLLKEINPLNMRGLSREKVVSQIKSLIRTSYLFLGYTEFANYIQKKSDVSSDLIKNKEQAIKERLQQQFNNRLIIIDEVHNIRYTEDNKKKRIATELFKLVENVENLRLLFLSATPLYNSYKEIIWLINIMNLNDGRSTIELKDVFDTEGNFKVNERGEEVGRQLLERKATGYVSFVRGNNPYTFPFRIWPDEFAVKNTLIDKVYPQSQLNDKSIERPIQFLSLYLVDIDGYQTSGYNYIINKLSESEKYNIEEMEQLGYIQLQKPLEALNIVYPNDKLFEEDLDTDIKVENLVGKGGLNATMTYSDSMKPPSKTNFKYRDEILELYGRIFSPEKIGVYSSKIKSICDNIINSNGVILIYSQYLDGGLIPIALALEEMGITRYGSVNSLFSKKPVENLDLNTYTNTNSKTAIPAKYIMITGDIKLSPNNVSDLLAATNKNNVNGHNVKVILISQAGSEGLDFKFIRQVHILEPWYNLSRIEQIIGRAVRNCSHKDLPFIQRNVQIFLYGSVLVDESIEAADLYVYRLAEEKAIKIGEVTRTLKEVAVDCLLNSDQLNFAAENMQLIVKQELSNRITIDYSIGDKPYSAQCDYMDTCMYKCKPVNNIGEINELSYSANFLDMNIEKIIHRIKQVMKEKYYYKNTDLIQEINIIRQYPLVQIYAALDQLINDSNEYIIDKYDRLGKLVNIGDYYFFQPIELENPNISIYERSVPIPYKNSGIPISINSIASITQAKNLDLSPKIEQIEAKISDDVKVTKQEVDEAIDSAEEIKEPEIVPVENEPIINKAEAIIKRLKTDYETSTTKQIILRGEKDAWYKYSYLVLTELETKGISKEILDDLLISHIIESELFENTLNLINYLYFAPNLTNFEEKIKNYFDNYILTNKTVTGLLLVNWNPKSKKPIQQLVIKDSKQWRLAEPEDWRDLLPTIEKYIISKKDLNNIFGFISNFKNVLMVFKVKENKPGNSGARCDQGSKTSAEKLNMIVGSNEYKEADLKKISSTQLCVLQEYLLRLNDYNKKDSKRWFLTPSEAVITNEHLLKN